MVWSVQLVMEFHLLSNRQKNPHKAELLRGTTMAVVLSNDPSCPNLVAASVYDTKLVHFLSTVTESVHWIEKKRKV